MIEMLTKLEEAPRDRHGFKRLTKFIRALGDNTGVDFYPCMYGGKDGKMCAVVGAKSESGADLCLAAFPGARTLLCVRGGSATRQLEAESPADDAPSVGALLESVLGPHLDEIAGRIGDELTVAACGLEWRLVPIAPPKEEEGGMPQMGGGKSGVDPAMEARIRKALAEQLASEGCGGAQEQP